MPVIPALGRLRQEDWCEFETSLGYNGELTASLSYIARPCLKKTKKRERERERNNSKPTFPLQSFRFFLIYGKNIEKYLWNQNTDSDIYISLLYYRKTARSQELRSVGLGV